MTCRVEEAALGTGATHGFANLGARSVVVPSHRREVNQRNRFERCRFGLQSGRKEGPWPISCQDAGGRHHLATEVMAPWPKRQAQF
jgi:hypothetical protein